MPIRTDAVTLMRRAGMEPDEWQIKALNEDRQQQLWLCHRQFGKSSIAAAKAWEIANNIPGSLTLLLSRTLRQSGELFRKVKTFYHASDIQVGLIKDTELSLETEHRSRIISLPAKADTVVGYSAPDCIIIDEAARVPDELYYVIRPMLAMSAGRIIALSTPWGRRGWFHEVWSGQEDDEKILDLATVQELLHDLGMTVTEEELASEPQRDFNWSRMKVAAPDNRRLSKRFLANERMKVPDLIFQSEWLCHFTDTEDTVFSYDDIQAMLSDEIPPMFYAGAGKPPEPDDLLTDAEPLFAVEGGENGRLWG